MKYPKPVSWRKGWQYTLTFASIYTAVLLTTFALGAGPDKVVPEWLPLPGALKQLARDASSWVTSFATERDMPKAERMRLLIEENAWKNGFVMWIFPDDLVESMPHVVQTWLRNWIMCAAVYFGFGGLWCYYTYFCFGDKLFQPGTIPSRRDIWEQIKVSNIAMPLYAVLPTCSEWLGEHGLSMAYPRIENVGWPLYLMYFFLYMSSVEFGVYWMHRGLHDVKWAYKMLHHTHHKYNKEHTLSPFAGLAFNAVDGIIQAIPYGYTLLYCPMHFLTQEVLMFATGVWTTNIHDCIHGKVFPIMGAGYHTIHHTVYKVNYGHYFTFFDSLYNTCLSPEDYEGGKGFEQQLKEGEEEWNELAKQKGLMAANVAKAAAGVAPMSPGITRPSTRAMSAVYPKP